MSEPINRKNGDAESIVEGMLGERGSRCGKTPLLATP